MSEGSKSRKGIAPVKREVLQRKDRISFTVPSYIDDETLAWINQQKQRRLQPAIFELIRQYVHGELVHVSMLNASIPPLQTISRNIVATVPNVITNQVNPNVQVQENNSYAGSSQLEDKGINKSSAVIEEKNASPVVSSNSNLQEYEAALDEDDNEDESEVIKTIIEEKSQLNIKTESASDNSSMTNIQTNKDSEVAIDSEKTQQKSFKKGRGFGKGLKGGTSSPFVTEAIKSK